MTSVDRVIPSEKQRLVADRYLLTDLMGRGGMGAVWRATDQLLQRAVAVKELPFGGDGKGSRRALREARTIARVSHPHAIDIYDLVEHEDRLRPVSHAASAAKHATRQMPPDVVMQVPDNRNQ